MRIVDEWQTFIHTHFQTDGLQLSSDRVREIEQALLPLLRNLGIVYGIHLEREPNDPGIRIVLECRPAEKELSLIRNTLMETLRPIPRRPRPTNIRYASDEGTSLATPPNHDSANEVSSPPQRTTRVREETPTSAGDPAGGGPP